MRFQAHWKNAVDFSLPPNLVKSAVATEYRSKTPLADRAFALFVLIAAGPFLLILGLCIAIGGQIPIFIQDRIGHQCKTFRIFKFRTIPNDGWEAAERAAAGSHLARLQLFVFRRVSKVLRTTGLDELPQFVNILKGDMQIIGPRPLIKADFDKLPEGREVRCVVLPGITGLAQINGGQDLDSDSKLALDLYVIDHLSFPIVVKIFVRTVLRIFGGAAATSAVCSVDLAAAKEHMVHRMRLAAITKSDLVDRAKQTPPKYSWLKAPKKALRPIQLSSARGLSTTASDAPTKVKKTLYAVAENH